METVPAKKEIIVEPGPPDLDRKGAEIFCRTAKTCTEKKGRFAVAISGGSTPRGMHRQLSKAPFISKVPWQDTHIFWVDERMVPTGHPHSNFGTAKNDFLNHVPIPLSHLHPMPTDGNPDEAAAAYEEELRTFFKPAGRGWPIFDLIFLGLGTDGHTASLFPGQSWRQDSSPWVAGVMGKNPDIYRLSLTYPVLNNAEHVLFLVSGKGKAAIVKRIFENEAAGLPAQEIQPLRRNVTWLLDRNAASRVRILKRED